jgi:hypothetical protein
MLVLKPQGKAVILQTRKFTCQECWATKYIHSRAARNLFSDFFNFSRGLISDKLFAFFDTETNFNRKSFSSYCEDWKMMFTQLILEHEWFYSLKVLAHFRSKERMDFSTYDTQIFCLTVAQQNGSKIKKISLENMSKSYLKQIWINLSKSVSLIYSTCK